MVDVGYFGPFGLENLDELAFGREFFGNPGSLWSVILEGRLVALSQRSQWIGCRVVMVTRAKAIQFGHELLAWFARDFFVLCHGSLWCLDGQYLAGPDHRGLNRFPVGYLPDGSVVVDLTRLELSAPSS